MSSLRIEAWLVMGCLALTACGGTGSGPEGAGTAAASAATQGSSRYSVQWRFDADPGWQLQAESVEHARAALEQGLLALESAFYTDSAGVAQCPVAAASVTFGDATSRADRDASLRVRLDVRRWDTGQGRFMSHLPTLEVLHHGLRSSLPVGGFSVMPGTVTFRWQRGSGWTAAYDGQAARTVTPVELSDTGGPALKLWIDGCAEAMSQSLRVERVQVDAD